MSVVQSGGSNFADIRVEVRTGLLGILKSVVDSVVVCIYIRPPTPPSAGVYETRCHREELRSE